MTGLIMLLSDSVLRDFEEVSVIRCVCSITLVLCCFKYLQ